MGHGSRRQRWQPSTQVECSWGPSIPRFPRILGRNNKPNSGFAQEHKWAKHQQWVLSGVTLKTVVRKELQRTWCSLGSSPSLKTLCFIKRHTPKRPRNCPGPLGHTFRKPFGMQNYKHVTKAPPRTTTKQNETAMPSGTRMQSSMTCKIIYSSLECFWDLGVNVV